MNRLKVWLFVLLAAAVGIGDVALRTRAEVRRAIGEADSDLSAASALVGTTRRLQASDAAAIAGVAARDAALLQALAAPAPLPRRARRGAPPAEDDAESAARQARVESAAKAAVEGAAAALGMEIPAGSWWAAANRDWIEKKASAATGGRQEEAAAFLRDAAAGRPRRGLARVNDALWYGVAVPAGEGAALVLFLPLDLPWARALRAATGVDVTIAAGLPKPVTTARPEDARRAEAAARPGAPASAGTLSRAAAGGKVLGLGPLPLLFARPPAERVLSVALDGVPDGRIVLASPLAPRIAPVAGQQASALVGVLLLLVAGAAVAFAVRPEGSAPVPDELVQAASRVASGDFTARSPALAGRFGTLAEGLNRAAEEAQRAATANLYGAPTAEAVAAAGAAAPEAAGVVGGTFEASPVARTASPWAALSSAARAAPAADPEEEHWQQVFDDFLRVRRECGEPAEGLTYDRFRVKLAKNREQLVQKYACRTVRFQVYVKEGKAALKATPVK